MYTAVYTACTRPVHGRGHGRVHGRVQAVYKFPCTRPCSRHEHGLVTTAVYTARKWLCTRPDTAMYTACTLPWTRPMYTALYKAVYGPCTGRVLGRVHGCVTAVCGSYTAVNTACTCTKPIEFVTLSQTLVITSANKAKQHIACHRKFIIYGVKRDLGKFFIH